MASYEHRSACFTDFKQVSVILKALHEQRSVQRFCDVILRVCGEQIFAHSNVLAAASPYFGSFLGYGQDLPRAFSQKTPQIIEIHIDGSEGDGGYGEAVRKVVDFMYTSTIELSYYVLTQVMEIAKIMQMDDILIFCDRFQKGESGDIKVEDESTTLHVKGMQEIATQTAEDTEFQISQTASDSDDYEPLTTNDENTPQTKMTPVSSKTANLPENLLDTTRGLVSASRSPVTGRGISTKKRRGRPPKSVATGKSTDVKSEDTKEEEDIKEDSLETCENEEKKFTADEITALVDCALSEHDQHSTLRPTRSSPRIRAGHRRRGRYGHIFGQQRKRQKIIKSGHKMKDGESEDPKTPDQKGGKYSCDDCSYSTPNIHHYRRHRDVHNAGKYRCSKCSFQTSRARILNEHEKTHLHAENICSFCDHQTESAEKLSLHLERHSGPQPYFCPTCDMKFKTKTQLGLHLPKHSVEKPFVCGVCEAGFKWKHALKNHMIVHSSNKDHLCDVCGFATAHKSQLKAHRLIHTGETFKCNILGCNFQATKRQNLKYHMLTHTHEKPHQCEVCGQSFSLIKNMKRHMLLHATDRPYKCDSCNFSTTRFDKLKEHQLKQHGMGEPPLKKHRISDYMDVSQQQLALVQQCEIADGVQVQVQDDGQLDGTETTEVVTLHQPDGGTVPITITRVQSIQYADGSYPTIQYITQVAE